MSSSSKLSSLPVFELEEKNRYRLYAAMSCPFAHRVRLVRLLHGLEDSFEITFVTGQTPESFTFDAPAGDPEFGALTLKDVYNKAAPESFAGRATVPMILDKTNKKMVNNESLDSAFALAAQCKSDSLNLMPNGTEDLAHYINDSVSIAVYKYLSTPDPKAKQGITDALWAQFDQYNQQLATQDFLLGNNNLSVADLALWASLIRYDNVYARQFGIHGKSIRNDYPHLAEFIKRIWNMPTKNGSTTLGEDASMAEIIRMYWISGNLAPKAGNDPTSDTPQVLPVF